MTISNCSLTWQLQIDSGNMTMEHQRNQLRAVLNQVNQNLFPLADQGTSVEELAMEFLKTAEQNIKVTVQCTNCGFQDSVSRAQVLWDCTVTNWKEHTYRMGSYKNRSIQDWTKVFTARKSLVKCNACSGKMVEY